MTERSCPHLVFDPDDCWECFADELRDEDDDDDEDPTDGFGYGLDGDPG